MTVFVTVYISFDQLLTQELRTGFFSASISSWQLTELKNNDNDTKNILYKLF